MRGTGMVAMLTSADELGAALPDWVFWARQPRRRRERLAARWVFTEWRGRFTRTFLPAEGNLSLETIRAVDIRFGARGPAATSKFTGSSDGVLRMWNLESC